MENVTLIEHKEFVKKCEEMDEKDKYHAIMDVHDASKKKTKKKKKRRIAFVSKKQVTIKSIAILTLKTLTCRNMVKQMWMLMNYYNKKVPLYTM